MIEDNLDPSSQINYNMERKSTYRRGISQFQIQKDLKESQDNLEEGFNEFSAKNILIDIDQTWGTHPLRPKNQKNIVNGWIENKHEKQRPLKSFRTKTYSRSKKAGNNLINSSRNSIDDFENHIPKLKDILKKLESPQKPSKNQGLFGNSKENAIYSHQKHSISLQNNSTIPYRFQPVFHTINLRMAREGKRKRIITFTDYKEKMKKSHHFDLGESESKKMANILIIKQAGKKMSLER